MPPPLILWDEVAALDQLATFVRAACPEVPAVDVYRARPTASPSKYGGPSVLLFPLTPIPEDRGPFATETDAAQRQRWAVTITTASAGAWTATVLGQAAAPYVAGGGDDAADIAAGVRAAVDALALAVTTSAIVGPPPGFGVLADVAGASLGVSLTAPPGGVYGLAVVDDNIRRAVWNFGLWRVRLIFRDVPSAGALPAGVVRSTAPVLAERTRRWLQASSLPTTNGLAYPYRRDQLQAAPARLSFLACGTPVTADQVDGQTWTRAVAMDVEFEVPVCMTHDVPSLDAIGLQALTFPA